MGVCCNIVHLMQRFCYLASWCFAIFELTHEEERSTLSEFIVKHFNCTGCQDRIGLGHTLRNLHALEIVTPRCEARTCVNEDEAMAKEELRRYAQVTIQRFKVFGR